MRLIKRIPVADDPDGIFYDPSDKLVYAASGDAKVATLIDPATETKVATIPLGGEPEFAACDAQSHPLYQNLKDVDSVVAVNVSERKLVQRWPLAGCEAPTGMTFDGTRRRLFVVCSGNAKLVIFGPDAHCRLVAAPIPLPTIPSLAVSMRPAGPASFRSSSGMRPTNTICSIQSALHYGAHTLAVDPVTHAVYVGYASLLVS